MNAFLNFVSFQIAWFACILGAATQQEVIAIFLGLVCVIFNLWLSPQPRIDLSLVFKGVLLGIVVDSLLIQLGFISFTTQFWSSVSPIWMWIIWAAMMTTLNASMRWLKPYLALSALLGALLGGLSYLAGVRLGAGEFAQPWQSWIAISVVWFFVMPILMFWSRQVLPMTDPKTIKP